RYMTGARGIFVRVIKLISYQASLCQYSRWSCWKSHTTLERTRRIDNSVTHMRARDVSHHAREDKTERQHTHTHTHTHIHTHTHTHTHTYSFKCAHTHTYTHRPGVFGGGSCLQRFCTCPIWLG